MPVTFSKDWTALAGADQLWYASLYSAQGATDDGVWFDTRGAHALCVEVNGITTATVRLSGSNDSTIPSDANDETTHTDITADGFIKLDRHEIPRWVKIHVHAWTSGSIDVDVKMIYSGNASS